MAELPQQLLARLGPETAAALLTALDAVGEELSAVYAANVADHREARGDNAQLFGLKIWVHGDFRITGRLEDHRDVSVVHSNGSYSIEAGPVSVGVYKLGDTADEDVHECFPDTSPTKRAYAERNGAQLRLFDSEPHSPLPLEARYALNDLIVGHFGNPRDGLVKWFVGAPTSDARGIRRWAWIVRQPLPDVAAQPKIGTQPVVPFDAREAEVLEVRPRATRQVS